VVLTWRGFLLEAIVMFSQRKARCGTRDVRATDSAHRLTGVGRRVAVSSDSIPAILEFDILEGGLFGFESD